MDDRRLFLSKPSSCRHARWFVLDFVRRSGHVVDEEVLRLLVTEVVTNAISHGGDGPIAVVVMFQNGVRVEDTDHNAAAFPRVLHTGPESVGGRGMLIVEKLSRRWGTFLDPDGGKVVWFELDDHLLRHC